MPIFVKHPVGGASGQGGARVQWDIMDTRAAIAACEKAVERDPDGLRFQYQLGRALLRARRRDEGLPQLFAAAPLGSVMRPPRL